MAFTRIIGLALAAALVAGTAGPLSAQSAGAQAAASEQELLARAAKNPQEVLALLDLVRLYVEQGRLAEADEMLRRTSLAIQRTRALQAPERRLEPTVSFDQNAPLRVGGDIAEPKKLRDVRPVYPEEARAAGVQGIIIIEATIDPQGEVSDAHVLRSVPMLDEPALDAVRQWRFTPTLLNGEPVSVIMTVTVNFSLK